MLALCALKKQCLRSENKNLTPKKTIAPPPPLKLNGGMSPSLNHSMSHSLKMHHGRYRYNLELKKINRRHGDNIKINSSFYRLGGLGDAVCSAVAEERGIIVKKLGVTEVARSGKPEELIHKYGISADCIADAVRSMLRCSIQY